MTNLTLRDYKILAELDKNAKASFNQIGRKLRLSSSVVERRIKNLLQKGIIKEFKTIINYKKLGWTYYGIYVRLQNITKNKRIEILNYLERHPLSGQILQCDGRWHLIYGFFVKDIFQLDKELKKFENKFGEYVKETEKIVHIGSHHYRRGYLLDKKSPYLKEPFLGGYEIFAKLDKASFELLNFIRSHARVNIIEMSEKLKVSVDQIRYKIKRLTEKNIILGHWLHLNPEKFGLHFYRVLLKLKNLNEKNEASLLRYLNYEKNVIRANKVFGSWDYFVDLEINTKDFRKFMDEFTKIFSNNIQEYEILIIYDEVKFTFSPVFY
ncbi:winged helix-turn-helix transcriptional regulator [Candidatus Pacearchaeota archaeon]|nr:winged helix-turn-helix transcriptional regulator [Candidatus Pacearchaeota archaeon]